MFFVNWRALILKDHRDLRDARNAPAMRVGEVFARQSKLQY